MKKTVVAVCALLVSAAGWSASGDLADYIKIGDGENGPILASAEPDVAPFDQLRMTIGFPRKGGISVISRVQFSQNICKTGRGNIDVLSGFNLNLMWSEWMSAWDDPSITPRVKRAVKIGCESKWRELPLPPEEAISAEPINLGTDQNGVTYLMKRRVLVGDSVETISATVGFMRAGTFIPAKVIAVPVADCHADHGAFSVVSLDKRGPKYWKPAQQKWAHGDGDAATEAVRAVCEMRARALGFLRPDQWKKPQEAEQMERMVKKAEADYLARAASAVSSASAASSP